jgi:hypothetical protein
MFGSKWQVAISSESSFCEADSTIGSMVIEDAYIVV